MTIRCVVCDHNDAGHRYACDQQCVPQLQRQLRELDIYATWMLTPEPYRGGIGSRGAPGYASRSPARDDVIAAMDIRSDGDMFGPDDVPQPIISIPGGLRYIATWVSRRDGQPAAPRPLTVTRAVAYLLGRVHSAAMERWIVTFAEQVGILHRQARALAHDQPPQPIGTCRDCTGDVYADRAGARCGSCPRTYTGLDLVRLHQTQGGTMSYNGPATLICEDGREIEVEAHLDTDNSRPLKSWRGYLTAENPSELLNAGGNAQIRLPDGSRADLIVNNVRFNSGGDTTSTEATVVGTGKPPY